MYLHVHSSNPIFQASIGTLKALAYIAFAPFLLVAVLAALMCVIIDFGFFRVRDMVSGNPEPKGLWEF